MTFPEHVDELANWLLDDSTVPVTKICPLIASYFSRIFKNYLNDDPLVNKELNDLFKESKEIHEFDYTYKVPKNSFSNLLFEILNRMPHDRVYQYKSMSVLNFVMEYDWSDISYAYYHIIWNSVKDILKLKNVNRSSRIKKE